MYHARQSHAWDHTAAIVAAWTGSPIHAIHPYVEPPQQTHRNKLAARAIARRAMYEKGRR